MTKRQPVIFNILSRLKQQEQKIDIFSFIKQRYGNISKTQSALANEEEKDKSLIDS